MRLKFSNCCYMAIFLLVTHAYATNIPQDLEESGIVNPNDDEISQSYFENDVSVLLQTEEITQLKQSYISPYNYTQDPVALDLGYDARTDSPNGTYHGGISTIFGQNHMVDGGNSTINTDIAEFWGQTGRLGGFALGGSVTGVFNLNQPANTATLGTTARLIPSQAYIDYQYKNKLDVIAGNILITTPWVNSFGSNPGATFAMGNNSYQGVMANIQALPSLFITAFSAWGYLQYPNYLPNQQTFYNTMSGPLSGIGETPVYGPSGAGLIWSPVDSYTGQLWLYNFADYANMAYVDNSYHVELSALFSFDFGLQAFSQASTGSALTNQVSLPGQTTSAGLISSNGTGGKVALNIANNTTSVSFNNIFGSGFLNGGMVTPYTYGMETDPLYTTPALTSLAELGSGYAYTIRNSTQFLDKSLKFNLSASQFIVNQVYATQATLINEYDAAFIYRIPHTTMNVWTRLVYVEQPTSSGGNMWQPRFIYNWTF